MRGHPSRIDILVAIQTLSLSLGPLRSAASNRGIDESIRSCLSCDDHDHDHHRHRSSRDQSKNATVARRPPTRVRAKPRVLSCGLVQVGLGYSPDAQSRTRGRSRAVDLAGQRHNRKHTHTRVYILLYMQRCYDVSTMITLPPCSASFSMCATRTASIIEA